LFELIDLFRDSKTFTIITNGSYQRDKFWQELVARLDDRDTVMFSIDGLEDTNHLYRRNSDWPTILSALHTVSASPINLEWATNVFSFNYQNLDEIKKFAESFGAKFVCKLTSRFGDPALRPPEQFVNQESEFYIEMIEKNIAIEPQCQSTSKNMISSDHMYVPCGPICSPFVFHKTAVWKDRNRWSIRDTTMDHLLESVLTPWVEEIKHSPATANTVCKMLCKPGQPWIRYHE
jgi:sulfatase maturation enzyme AslB (radical SAM superfamily)